MFRKLKLLISAVVIIIASLGSGFLSHAETELSMFDSPYVKLSADGTAWTIYDTVTPGVRYRGGDTNRNIVGKSLLVC